MLTRILVGLVPLRQQKGFNAPIADLKLAPGRRHSVPLHRNRRASTKGWDKIPSHFGRTTKVSCHGCWFLPGAGPRPHHRSLGVRKSAESRQPGTVTSRCDRRSPHRLGYPDAGRRPRLEAAAISPQRGCPSWRLLSRKRIQAYENEEVREFLLKAIWLGAIADCADLPGQDWGRGRHSLDPLTQDPHPA